MTTQKQTLDQAIRIFKSYITVVEPDIRIDVQLSNTEPKKRYSIWEYNFMTHLGDKGALHGGSNISWEEALDSFEEDIKRNN
jgi:hypothetical protein